MWEPRPFASLESRSGSLIVWGLRRATAPWRSGHENCPLVWGKGRPALRSKTQHSLAWHRSVAGARTSGSLAPAQGGRLVAACPARRRLHATAQRQRHREMAAPGLVNRLDLHLLGRSHSVAPPRRGHPAVWAGGRRWRARRIPRCGAGTSARPAPPRHEGRDSLSECPKQGAILRWHVCHSRPRGRRGGQGRGGRAQYCRRRGGGGGPEGYLQAPSECLKSPA